MIRVLIVDDQELVRAGFRMILEVQDDLNVIGEAGDGAEAIEAARTLEPDVVLMDVRMPETDGIEATRRLVAAGSRARVLMLTTFDADEYVYDAMKAGASGFLLKNAPRHSWLPPCARPLRARRSSRPRSSSAWSRSSSAGPSQDKLARRPSMI